MKNQKTRKKLKYIFIPFILLMIPALVFSQAGQPKTAQPLQHQKQLFFSSDGRVFFPSEMKLYLKITNSPEDNAPSTFLKSRTGIEKHRKTKGKVSPMAFSIENEGPSKIAVLSGKRKSLIKKKSVKQDFGKNHQLVEMFFLNLDKKPPTSSVVFSSAPMIFFKKVRIYGESIQFRLKMTDKASGIRGTFFSINGAVFNAYQHPLIFSKEKDYSFRYYSVDNVGNVENLNQVLFSIDLTPPTSSFQIKNDHSADILSPRTNITLQSTDNNAGVSKVFYGFKKNQTAAFKEYSKKPITIDHLKEGKHSFYYFAEDKVKNTETRKQFNFYLDRTPPLVSISIQGDYAKNTDKAYVSKRSRIQISASDNKSGVKSIQYSFNTSKDKQLYRSPLSLPDKAGQHHLKYLAHDVVENKTKIQTFSLYQDLQPPKTHYKILGHQALIQQNNFVSSQTNIHLIATDTESGVQHTVYTLDDKKEKKYSEPLRLQGDGLHKLIYYAKDRVNNVEEKRAADFTVDNVPPILFTQFSIGEIDTRKTKKTSDILKVYPKSTMLFIGATDQAVGLEKIKYTINKEPVKSYNSTLVFNNTGEYVVKITASDKLQNKKTERLHFFIE